MDTGPARGLMLTRIDPKTGEFWYSVASSWGTSQRLWFERQDENGFAPDDRYEHYISIWRSEDIKAVGGIHNTYRLPYPRNRGRAIHAEEWRTWKPVCPQDENRYQPRYRRKSDPTCGRRSCACATNKIEEDA